MVSKTSDSASVTFAGSMKAGLYTAQLGVSLVASSQALLITTPGRTVRVDIENFVELKKSSIFRFFKRGIVIVHNQPDTPRVLIFYPRSNRDLVQSRLREIGWSGHSG